MDRIARAAARMGTLIDDLLEFSRVGRAQMKRTPVELDTLLAQVREDLEPDLTARQVRWEVAPLPRVQGDPRLLQLVLTNLVENAIKFTRERTPAVVALGSYDTPTHDVVFVRDNGVGFDSAHADRLFGVFQRLPGAKEYEGTGIGLAHVRQIVDRHGGRTWAQATPGAGATFFFSLPKA
jgi:light-regulated signal transduction histidine kinase (bacteriophytochrome)